MIWANLFHRKARTLVTLVGIAIGVAAIVALGAVAGGMRTGFSAMTQGTQADLVLTQADSISVLLSSIDEAAVDEMRTWPEVAEIDGVLLTNALSGGTSYIFLFGHDPDGFAIEHFRVAEGSGLSEVQHTRGRPMLLGRRAAQNLGKAVGDAFEIANSVFRVVGIYETGNSFEDGGAVIALQEAQLLTLQQRHISMLYVQLHSPSDAERFKAKAARAFPDLAVSTSTSFAEQEQTLAIIDGIAVAVAGLAVVLGGIVMTNTLFMSVFERTREIGLLRAVGWRRRRVMALILGESLTLALLGGLVGTGLGVLSVWSLGRSSTVLSMYGVQLSPQLLARALITVVALGLVGGAYPAWWASHLLPLEALRYEGGGHTSVPRFVPGWVGRNLWRQRTRTILTLLSITVSIAVLIALGALLGGGINLMTELWRGSQTDLVAIQAGTDSDISAIDERIGARIVLQPDVEAVSGVILTAMNTEQMPMLIVFGYHPREYAIRHFRIIRGEPLTARHQVIIGWKAAEQMGIDVGDTLRLLNSSFRVVGVYETGLGYEEIGAVVSLREAQTLVGKPHQVMYYAIKLRDPERAQAVRDRLAADFPELNIALTAESAETMSDFKTVQDMFGQISFLAVLIGSLGMFNTMLMSVLERTREIGVLRALGWRKRRVLGLILREALTLGGIGGVLGIALGVGLNALLPAVPGLYGTIEPIYTLQMFVQAMLAALVAGAAGGLYPAWRATRMRPVEALRYE